MLTSSISISMSSQLQQFQQNFQQLGKGLSSGNLSAAQSDFATLQKDLPQTNSSSSTAQGSSPILSAPTLNTLAKKIRELLGNKGKFAGFQEIV